MERLISVLIRCYAQLLRLYPRAYRSEFAGEMLQDFSALAADAARRGRLELFLFCLRELVDFPISLLQTHLKENGMLIRMRAEPLNTAWRGALVFGAAFFLSIWLNSLVFWTEANVKPLIPARLQFLFERFLLDWTSVLLTALAFGVLFALLFAGRTRFWRYFVVGALSWLLQLAVLNFAEYFFEINAFRSAMERNYIYNLGSILRGAILGSVFVLAQAERKGVIGALAACVIAYPLATFFTVKWVVDTAWLFPVMALLRFALIAGVLILATTFASNRQQLLAVAAGALGYIILFWILGWSFAFASYFTRLMPPVPPGGVAYEDPLFWPVVGWFATFYLVLGSFFGFLLG